MNDELFSRWFGQDIGLLCLDAGNTLVFLDHERLAATAARKGFEVSPAALVRAEDGAMRAAFRGTTVKIEWSRSGVPAARGWGFLMGTLFMAAGADAQTTRMLLESVWEEHLSFNFWSKVPEGLIEGLREAQKRGVRTVVVSNSEGRLESLFARLGILELFDRVIDSGVVGVEKPDPRIFRVALEPFGVQPEKAVHLGDSPADVLGARAAGLRVGLIDPHGRLDGEYPDVPRVPGALEILNWLAARRPT